MFENFTQNLAAQRDLPAYLRRQLIGDNTMIDGPFGPQKKWSMPIMWHLDAPCE